MALSTVIQAFICFTIFTGSCEDIIETTPDAKPSVEGPTNGPNTSRFKMTSLPTTQPVPGRNLIMSQTQAISGGIAKEFLEYTSSGNVTETVTWNGSTGAADEDTNEYLKRLVKAEEVLWLYVSPVLMWTGTVANILCIVVLQSPQFRRAPSSLTLTLLALTDIANLWVALLRRWVLFVTDYDIDLIMFGQVSCKVSYLFIYLITFMSSWTLVLVNAERTLSVLTPLRAREICSRKRMGIAWAIISVILVCVNIHSLWTGEIYEDPDFGAKICGFKSDVAADYVFYSDMWLSSVVPSFIIFTGNCIIAYRLTVAQARRKKMNAAEGKNPISSTTIMLFVVCTVFILTTLPITIFYWGTGDYFFTEWNDETVAEYWCVSGAMQMIYSLNNTCNFFLYLLSGRKFRAAFFSVVCCREVKKNNQSRTMSTRQTTTGDVRSTTSEGRV